MPFASPLRRRRIEGAMLDHDEGKGWRRNFGTFRDPVSLCPRKFDRVEGRLLSRERVEGEI